VGIEELAILYPLEILYPVDGSLEWVPYGRILAQKAGRATTGRGPVSRGTSDETVVREKKRAVDRPRHVNPSPGAATNEALA